MSTEKAAAMDKAIDLSHHLSNLSKSRQLSPLKGLQKYWGREGLISLAGGMPDPAYFPFNSVSGETLVPDSFPKTKPSESSLFNWFWTIFGSGSTQKTSRFTVPKHAAKKGDIDLAAALQYSPATGLAPLQQFTHDFTGKVFKPAYSDWTTLVHIGNTDGNNRCFSTFCNPGEMYLVEEWTYPSAVAAAQPMGLKPAPVKVDGQGMSATDLERVLSEWDETSRGAKRPHVMYTIPIGQNPTGATMGAERKRAIYDICVKYDVIIFEDDPYYFLQEGAYSPKSERVKAQPPPPLAKDEDEQTRFLNNLSPSYVRFDYQGRVVRLDSFSKIIAPGSRMGWFTCNPLFAERLERQGETSTAAPCGFSQSLITQLLSVHWGTANFLRWIQGLQTQYTLRRDFFVDCIFDEFELQPEKAARAEALFGPGVLVYTAYTKTPPLPLAMRGEMQEKEKKKKVPLFSFVPPSAGMFVWLKFHLTDDGKTKDGETFELRVWKDLADNGLLISPGTIFDVAPEDVTHNVAGEANFRISYSMGKHEDMKKGVKILAKVLNKYATST